MTTCTHILVKAIEYWISKDRAISEPKLVSDILSLAQGGCMYNGHGCLSPV